MRCLDSQSKSKIVTHSHGHSGEKLPIKTFNQVYYIPLLPILFSIFIHDAKLLNLFQLNIMNENGKK